MVYYIKFGEEEAVQFTTVVEAKEHIRAYEGEASIFIAKADEPAEDTEELEFSEFETKDEAVESLGEGEAHPEAKEADESEEGSEESADEESSEEKADDATEASEGTSEESSESAA